MYGSDRACAGSGHARASVAPRVAQMTGVAREETQRDASPTRTARKSQHQSADAASGPTTWARQRARAEGLHMRVHARDCY